MNTFYFLRHAKTQVDPVTPVSRWVLSQEGEKQASDLASNPEFQHVDVLIASAEDKSYLTIKPLADALDISIYRYIELNELDRDHGGFMTPEKYEETTRACLSQRAMSFEGWETADHALERFASKVEDLDAAHHDSTILIAGHGHTLNLYFASLLGRMDNVYERLKRTGFCSWGVVQNGKVVKDLVS